MPEADIRAAFLAACNLELAALKPGNVHRHADGHDMTVADFVASAEAAAPALARAGSPLGRRILEAVAATRAAVGCNTNLGILLACAPLALAAERYPSISLRIAIAEVLQTADAADAEAVFGAIALANPGGLGEAGEHDVRSAPRIGLLAAMRLAVARDRIACQYAFGFTDLFAFTLPFYRQQLERSDDAETAAGALYLSILARWPDSHLLRKFGDNAAQTVTREAAETIGRLRAETRVPARCELLLDWDNSLKRRGFNPGTSADLTVATLFAHGLLA